MSQADDDIEISVKLRSESAVDDVARHYYVAPDLTAHDKPCARCGQPRTDYTVHLRPAENSQTNRMAA
jgi:hypothetical protein